VYEQARQTVCGAEPDFGVKTGEEVSRQKLGWGCEAKPVRPSLAINKDVVIRGKEAITRGGATQRKTVPRHAEAVGLFLNLSLVPEVWQQLL
jgi:hypothetical protein